MFVVDCESDGPIPHKYSLVCFGAVKLDLTLNQTFYGETKPISDLWIPEALAISGFSREEHLKFDDPKETMQKFKDWVLKVNSNGRPVFVSDNPAYDFAWINYYMHFFLCDNVFGYSARRIGDLYCGLVKDVRASWKHLRKTRHSHFPVDDCVGNAEALLEMAEMGLKSLL